MIVVGARCAGSPLATLLARDGMRVCLLDRASFPSDTPSTHGIQPSGVTVLEDIGLRAPIEKAAAQIDAATLALADAEINVEDMRERFGAPMLNIRRITLDALLLEAAAAAGTEIRTNTAVTGLVQEHGRVVGVKTRNSELRAPVVVGADGARSTVARLVGAREYKQTPAGRVFMWAYFAGSDAPDDRAWLGRKGDHAFLGSPTDDSLFMAAVAPPAAQWPKLRADRETAHAEALRGWPELDAALAGAERVGPVQVMANWHGFFRESAGPGWVLVGDAGHFKDPTPGQGISDALRQVVQLSSAIKAALDAGDERALRTWWSWRDRDAWEMYWFARDMGSPEPSPLLVREIERRMATDPKLAAGLMQVLNHDIAPSRVFTPRLALTAMGGAWREHRGDRAHLVKDLGALMAEKVRHASPPRIRTA
ncbi:MAG: FAD-dependent monooxygenase [Thermoleophilaceae bacterium]|nr:FAD-dependent monooxygenase [Thermoleophilaceae bacterium]